MSLNTALLINFQCIPQLKHPTFGAYQVAYCKNIYIQMTPVSLFLHDLIVQLYKIITYCFAAVLLRHFSSPMNNSKVEKLFITHLYRSIFFTTDSVTASGTTEVIVEETVAQ